MNILNYHTFCTAAEPPCFAISDTQEFTFSTSVPALVSNLHVFNRSIQSKGEEGRWNTQQDLPNSYAHLGICSRFSADKQLAICRNHLPSPWEHACPVFLSACSVSIQPLSGKEKHQRKKKNTKPYERKTCPNPYKLQ